MTTTEPIAEPIEGYRPRMTEEEFEEWALRERVPAEWVEGEVILMAPASWDHGNITRWLLTLLGLFVEKHALGDVNGPEFMVRFQGRRRVPDILFVSAVRRSTIKRNFAEGAPDLIVEIISLDSQSRDRGEKYLEYQANGVREYWIIDPLSRQAEFHLLQGSSYVPIQTPEGIIRSATLDGFWLKVDWLWQRPLPNVYETAKTIGII